MDIYELYKIRKKRITGKRLSQLRHDGHITEEEYQELKDMYRNREEIHIDKPRGYTLKTNAEYEYITNINALTAAVTMSEEYK